MAATVGKKKCGKLDKTPRRPELPAFYVCLTIPFFTGVLGATGSVGQRFILLLANHPFLVLHAVGASSRSAGKQYRDAVRWNQATPMSDELGSLVVRDCKAEHFKDCDLVFSGLGSDVAGETGSLSFRRGF